MNNKFDDRINELYKKFLSEEQLPLPGMEPETEAEEEETLTDTELAAARRYVGRKKILGMNVGQSRKVKRGLEDKSKLERDYETAKIPEIITKLELGNDKLRADIADKGGVSFFD